MIPGSIVYLNGPSSSGKHSIIAVLQDILEEPWYSTGIDVWMTHYAPKFRGRGVRASEGLQWVFDDNGRMAESRTGSYGQRMIRGLYYAIAAFAHHGNNVLVDDVMFEDWMLGACARVLAHENAYFVGVRCRLDVAEARERARGNRPIGMAASCYTKVHRGTEYDLEIDTSEATPDECALRIKDFLDTGNPPRAFRSMATRVNLIEPT